VKIDFRNAFNEIERARMIREIAEVEALRDIHRFAEAHMRPKARIYYLSGGKLQLLEYRSVQGGAQGAWEAGTGFNVGTMKLFKRADRTVAQGGGCARATCDDLTLCGEPAHVWQALADLTVDMKEEANLDLQPTKSTVFSPSGVYGDKPEAVLVGGNTGTGDREGVVGCGVVVAGTPIGDEAFVANVVGSEVDRVCGLINPIHTKLSTVDARDHAFQVHRLSLCHRLDYLAQVVSPFTPGVLPALKRADAALRLAEVATLGVNPYAASPTWCSDPVLARDRAQLPVRHRGIGLPRVADIAFAAAVGGMHLTLPRFGDKTDPRRRHHCPWLG
jgi:hypothetical protein